MKRLGVDNLMVSPGEKIASRGDWCRRRGKGGISTLAVTMVAFGCKTRQMSAAPKICTVNAAVSHVTVSVATTQW